MGVLALVGGTFLLFLGGLALVTRPFMPAKTFPSPAPVDTSIVETSQTDSSSTVSAASGQASADLERLARLWQERTQEGSFSDYPIGPGDVLQISVPAMDELSESTAFTA